MPITTFSLSIIGNGIDNLKQISIRIKRNGNLSQPRVTRVVFGRLDNKFCLSYSTIQHYPHLFSLIVVCFGLLFSPTITTFGWTDIRFSFRYSTKTIRVTYNIFLDSSFCFVFNFEWIRSQNYISLPTIGIEFLVPVHTKFPLTTVNDLQHRAFWTQIVTEDEQNTFSNCKSLLWLNYKRLQTFHYAILFSLLNKCHIKGVMTQRVDPWEHQLKALGLYVLCQSHTNTSLKCVKHSKFLQRLNNKVHHILMNNIKKWVEKFH